MNTDLVALMEANPVVAMTAAGVLGCLLVLWWRRRDSGLRLAPAGWADRAHSPTERFWTAKENSAQARRRGAARGKAIGYSIGSHVGLALDLLVQMAYRMADHPAPSPIFERLFGLIGKVCGAVIGGAAGGGYGAGHGAFTGKSSPGPPFL